MLLRLHNKLTDTPKGFSKLITSLNEIPNSMNLNDNQKLFILAEQAVFCKYLLTIDKDNSDTKKYKENIIQAINKLPSLSKYKESNQDDYIRYKQILDNIKYNFDSNFSWLSISDILDDIRYISEYRQLAKEFYEPFLHYITNYIPNKQKLDSINYLPVVLYPKIYREGSLLFYSYATESFTSYSYDTKTKYFTDPANPILEYLSRFNWSGKNFGNVINTVSNLKIDLQDFNNNHISNIPHVVSKGLITLGQKKLSEDKNQINKFMTFVACISDLYVMQMTDINRIGTFLSRYDWINEKTIEYLMVKKPTMIMQKCLNETPELKFLERYLYNTKIYGKEAGEEGQEEPSDDNSDAADSDDFSIEDDMSESNDTSNDSSDMDDFSMGDDSSTDSNSDTTSSDTSDTDTSDMADETDTQPEDPTTIAYNILAQDPSVEAIMYRHRVASALRNVVKNPPPGLSQNIVNALRTWLTEWLYIVSPSTTKRFITLIFSNQATKTLSVK
jgi:hypothetical protein